MSEISASARRFLTELVVGEVSRREFWSRENREREREREILASAEYTRRYRHFGLLDTKGAKVYDRRVISFFLPSCPPVILDCRFFFFCNPEFSCRAAEQYAHVRAWARFTCISVHVIRTGARGRRGGGGEEPDTLVRYSGAWGIFLLRETDLPPGTLNFIAR